MVEGPKAISVVETKKKLGGNGPIDVTDLDPAQSAAVAEERGKEAVEALSGASTTPLPPGTSAAQLAELQSLLRASHSHGTEGDGPPPMLRRRRPGHLREVVPLSRHAEFDDASHIDVRDYAYGGDIMTFPLHAIEGHAHDMIHAVSGAANDDTDGGRRRRRVGKTVPPKPAAKAVTAATRDSEPGAKSPRKRRTARVERRETIPAHDETPEEPRNVREARLAREHEKHVVRLDMWRTVPFAAYPPRTRDDVIHIDDVPRIKK